MPILRNFIEAGRNPSSEARGISFQDVWGQGGEWTGGTMTASGARVTRDTALKFSTAYACIRLIAETWSSLPVHQFRPINYGDGREGRQRAPRPARWLDDPTGEGDTAFNLSEAISVSFSVGGNYYAEVITDTVGEPLYLMPLNPARVTPRRNDARERVYDVLLDSGKVVTVRRYRRGERTGILHIPAMRMPGADVGLSPLDLAREAVGLGLTAEAFGSTFFGNGARPGFVIELPEGTKATTEVISRLKRGWEEQHRGADKAHRPGVLSDGAKLKDISLAPEHAQFLGTREFQRSDVATWFGVPPHMVGIVSKSTSWGTGLEEQSTGFGRYTLTPPIRRAELGLGNILPNLNFVKWELAGLERASLAKRYAAYSVGRNGGWLSANDIRLVEDMEPIDDPSANEYWVPLNMELTGELLDDDPQPPPEEDE